MFETLEDLKIWINNYLEKKGKYSLRTAIKNSKRIQKDIINFTDFLPAETKMNQRCYHIINEIIEIPLCKHCGVNRVNFNKQDWTYFINCSKICASRFEANIKKKKETTIERYGVDNISKSEYFKKLIKEQNLVRYGVEWYQQSQEFREKSKKTCIEKYGVSSYSKTDEFIEKIKKTSLEKYDVNWPSMSEEVKNRTKQTCLIRYGKTHFMKNEIVKNRIFNSIASIYKADFYFQSDDFKEKTLYKDQKANNNKLFRVKNYYLPSGKVVQIQGYENFALDILINKYNEDDIVVKNSEIRKEIGSVKYTGIQGKPRTYLPDFFIKSEKKIIEIKSEYTFEKDRENNFLKRDACKAMQLEFEFWIINGKGEIVHILI